MAALAPSNTDRYRLGYSDGFNTHHLIMRTGGVTDAEAITALAAFLTAASNLIAEITITSFDFAPQGSDVFNPIVWTGAATFGSGALPALDRPFSYSFVGRSTGGHKARVYLFAVDTPNDDNWRKTAAENGNVADAIAALASNPGCFVAIDGIPPVWHPYANFGANDHWTKVIRGS
jgi:hypothetical protein